MKHDDFQIDIPNIICFHKARRIEQRSNAKRASRGILIAFDEYLKPYVKVVKESNIAAWLSIRGDILHMRRDLYIGFVYLPPEGSA